MECCADRWNSDKKLHSIPGSLFLESSNWGQWMTALPLRTTIGICLFFEELKFYGFQISLSIVCDGH